MKKMRPKKIDFENALNAILLDAKNKGQRFISVKSGEIHSKVGGYPGSTSHNMPSCCNVMRQRMGSNDKILSQPPKGNGATLEIIYCLDDK
jgi:5-methylcytosine-specific restriction protein A